MVTAGRISAEYVMDAVEEADLAGCKRTYMYMAQGLTETYYDIQR